MQVVGGRSTRVGGPISFQGGVKRERKKNIKGIQWENQKPISRELCKKKKEGGKTKNARKDHKKKRKETNTRGGTLS